MIIYAYSWLFISFSNAFIQWSQTCKKIKFNLYANFIIKNLIIQLAKPITIAILYSTSFAFIKIIFLITLKNRYGFIVFSFNHEDKSKLALHREFLEVQNKTVCLEMQIEN